MKMYRVSQKNAIAKQMGQSKTTFLSMFILECAKYSSSAYILHTNYFALLPNSFLSDSTLLPTCASDRMFDVL